MYIEIPEGGEFSCVASSHPRCATVKHNDVSYWIDIPETPIWLKIRKDSPEGKTISGLIENHKPNCREMFDSVTYYVWDLVVARMTASYLRVIIDSVRSKAMADGRESVRDELRKLIA